MSKQKTSKFKSLIAEIFGIREWKLTEEGKLDVDAETYVKLRTVYGEEFVSKFEQLLGDEGSESEASEDTSNINQNQTQMKKITMVAIGAILAVEAFEAAENGQIALTEEQLGKVEGGLLKLQEDLKTAGTEKDTAIAAKGTAEKALSDAISALDAIDVTVKNAEGIDKKVEAVKALLAAKPGAVATQHLATDDNTNKGSVIIGNDEINAEVKKYLS